MLSSTKSLVLSRSNRINSNRNTDDSNRNTNFQRGSPSSSIHAVQRLLGGVAVETTVVDEVEHAGQKRQSAAGD